MMEAEKDMGGKKYRRKRIKVTVQEGGSFGKGRNELLKNLSKLQQKGKGKGSYLNGYMTWLVSSNSLEESVAQTALTWM